VKRGLQEWSGGSLTGCGNCPQIYDWHWILFTSNQDELCIRRPIVDEVVSAGWQDGFRADRATPIREWTSPSVETVCLTNAMRRPSGDHAGSSTLGGPAVTRGNRAVVGIDDPDLALSRRRIDSHDCRAALVAGQREL
jgi:hypothetical protein